MVWTAPTRSPVAGLNDSSAAGWVLASTVARHSGGPGGFATCHTPSVRRLSPFARRLAIVAPGGVALRAGAPGGGRGRRRARLARPRAPPPPPPPGRPPLFFSSRGEPARRRSRLH